MNKSRRKEIYAVCKKLASCKIDKNTLDDIIDDIKLILSDEEYYRDNSVPENMTNKYEKADEACDNLSNAIYELKSALSIKNAQQVSLRIDKAIEYLYEASI